MTARDELEKLWRVVERTHEAYVHKVRNNDPANVDAWKTYDRARVSFEAATRADERAKMEREIVEYGERYIECLRACCSYDAALAVEAYVDDVRDGNYRKGDGDE